MQLPTVVRAGAERVDDLEPLYRSLHRHHLAIAAVPLLEDADVSWRRRRAWYTSRLGESGFLLIADLDGRPVGYAMVELLPGDDDTWPVGRRYAELVSLVVAEERRAQGVGGVLMDAVDAE